MILTAPPRVSEGMTLRRVLPHADRRAVGPFLFIDHFGPARLPPGTGLDVRPHPHIHLSTLTWLWEGAIVHRDSLGNAATLRPGDVQWMTAGRGIVHSERSPAADRPAGPRLHGLQTWVGLPDGGEDVDPSFLTWPADALPTTTLDGVALRVAVGQAFGLRSPVATHSPTHFVDARLPAGASLPPAGAVEEAAYVLDGAVRVGAERATAGQLALLDRPLLAEEPSHVVLLGGAPLGPRHLLWNFASSRPEALAQAAADWRAGRFPKVPGDEHDFIPMP